MSTGDHIDLGTARVDLRIAFCLAPYIVKGSGVAVDEAPMPDLPVVPGADILVRIMGNNGEVMVDVMPDGSVVLGDTYDPDEAAKRFWLSLGGLFSHEAFPG